MGPAGRRRTPSPGARTPILPDTASPAVVWQWSGSVDQGSVRQRYHSHSTPQFTGIAIATGCAAVTGIACATGIAATCIPPPGLAYWVAAGCCASAFFRMQ